MSDQHTVEHVQWRHCDHCDKLTHHVVVATYDADGTVSGEQAYCDEVDHALIRPTRAEQLRTLRARLRELIAELEQIIDQLDELDGGDES